MKPFGDELVKSARRLKAKRLDLMAYREAFYAAHPEVRDRADRRLKLWEALVLEVATGLLTMPAECGKNWDEMGAPALPAFVNLKTQGDTSGTVAVSIDWLPELAFGAKTSKGKKRETLERLNQYLIEVLPENPPLMTYRERALQIFDDEKALDAYVHEDSAFGSLPLARFGAYNPKSSRYATLAHRTAPQAIGKAGLIIENEHTYETLSRWNVQQGQGIYSFVAFGAGKEVLARAVAICELARSHAAPAVHYFGDMDPTGIAIAANLAMRIAAASENSDKIPLVPAIKCYDWLLQHGVRKELETNKLQAADTIWLGELAASTQRLFESKRWIPQEGLTGAQLQGLLS